MSNEAPGDVEDLPLTPYLVIETIAARHRLGEPFWTFPNRLRPILRTLGAAGWGWFDGAVTNDLRAGLTDKGKNAAFDLRYRPPIRAALDEATSAIASARSMVANGDTR